MTRTTMWRKTTCTNCQYTLEGSVSYYLHAKAWKAGHDLEKCREIRDSKNAFDEIFGGTLESLDKLSIIK